MEDEKQVETTVEDASTPEESEEVEADDTESETEESDVETESEEDSEPEGVDYEAELEKERKRLGKKIDKEREKRINAEKNKGLSVEEAEALVDERVAKVEKRLLRGQAEVIATNLAESDAERELILLKYDNSIILTGNLEEDMANAHALANRKSVAGTVSELKAKVKSNKMKTLGGSDAGKPAITKSTKKFTQEVIDAAEFAGVSPEEFVKQEPNT